MGQASFGLLEVRKGSQENKGLVTGNSDEREVEGKKKKVGDFNESKKLVIQEKKRMKARDGVWGD